ncbi:MAG: ribosome silencing factor [Flavobacteriales bacterium]
MNSRENRMIDISFGLHILRTFAPVAKTDTPKKKVQRKSPTELLVDTIIHGMAEIKAKNIVVMDMRGIRHAMADFFVICHGTSNTQVQSIAQSIERESLEMLSERPMHTEGEKNGQWILMDFVDVVAHVFDEPSRAFYGLEDLWADATSTNIDAETFKYVKPKSK